MAVKHDKMFHLSDGKKFSSLKTFAQELKKMSTDVYNHHVNPTKNDFANWVEHSMKHKHLSSKVNGEIDKIEMELHVLRELLFPTKQAVKKVVKKAVKATSKTIKKVANNKKVKKILKKK